MGAEVPKKALHVHVHVQVFHQAFDACTKVKRQSTENKRRRSFCNSSVSLILSLSPSSKHKERAHSHDLFFFSAAGILCIVWFYHTARGSFLLPFLPFLLLLFIYLPYLRYLNILFAFPKSTSTDVR